MKVLNSSISLDKFFQKLKSGLSLLLLDYDGTLAPFHIDPKQARPYSGVIERLNSLMTSDNTTLIIISGREISSLGPLLDLNPLPELWGLHGGQRRKNDGMVEELKLSEKQQEGLVQARQIAEKYSTYARREEKRLSLAIHWRGIDPSLRDRFEHIMIRELGEIAEGHDLALLSFKEGIEILSNNLNKGHAIEVILKEYGDSLNGRVAYLGDDITDEEAFSALDGAGLRVLVSSDTQSTQADIQIDPPEELLGFLDRWIEAISRHAHGTE